VSKGTANMVVLASGAVLVALALIPGHVGSSSTYKRIWAAGLWTTLLGLVADIVPEVVGPFAVLVIIASVVKQPGVLGGFLGGPTTGGGIVHGASVGASTVTSGNVNPATNPMAAGPVAPNS
jgi:hypothetical protein